MCHFVMKTNKVKSDDLLDACSGEQILENRLSIAHIYCMNVSQGGMSGGGDGFLGTL